MDVNTISLLKKRTFLPLFLTQFFGAFNDNAFKLAMLTLVSYHLSISQAQSERYQAIASALFTLPFFIFSATAGQLADKFDKALLIRFIKLFEIVLVCIGSMGFYFGNIALMMVVLTGMGIHSTFFGPLKYAILPDHLSKQKLLGGTALIEASTFLAILLGTILGALSVGGIKTNATQAIFMISGAALAGFFASLFILPAKGDANLQVDWNIASSTYQMIRKVVLEQKSAAVILTISWFWLIGIVMLTKLPDYTNYVLHAESTVFALFLGLFSIGIATGSLIINRLLRGKITLNYVPHAMLLLSLFAADLYWISPNVGEENLQSIYQFFNQFNHWRIAIDLFLLAGSGGAFVVPLYAYLQLVSPPSMRARTIAANNIINSLFMVLGTGLLVFLVYLRVSITGVFLILAILNALAVILTRRFLKRNQGIED
jgi:MFS family permease